MPATSVLSVHDQRVLIYLVIIAMLTQVMMFLFEYYFLSPITGSAGADQA